VFLGICADFSLTVCEPAIFEWQHRVRHQKEALFLFKDTFEHMVRKEGSKALAVACKGAMPWGSCTRSRDLCTPDRSRSASVCQIWAGKSAETKS